MAPIDAIKDLVEGRTKLLAFCEYLYKDKALQGLLSEDVQILPYTRKGTLLDYVLAQDCASSAAALNVGDAFAKFLTLKGVSYRADQGASDEYEFILSACPAWLSPPDFYLDQLKEAVAGVPDKRARLKAAKAKIAADFKFVDKHPRWVQSPNWLFKSKQPMVFVGQLGLGELLHDAAQAYLFFDPKDGEMSTLIQRS